ncbi:MAG: peptide ABC transporter substrate-binding protein [Pseudomonadales bacterium]
MIHPIARHLFFNATLILLAGGSVLAAERAPGNPALRLGNAGEPQTLDPQRYNLRLEETILTDLFLGLTAMNAEGLIVPGAAESWSTSEDGLTWTFVLRDDLKWSDGTPVTADDFVYSYRRLLDPRTAASLAYFMYPLKHARAVNAGELPVEQLGVFAPDPRTLVIELGEPYPHLPERLLYPTAFPVPRHVIERIGDDWVRAENWVSNGAYVLDEWRPQAYVRLRANPHFFEPLAIRQVDYYPLANEQNAYNRYRAGEVSAIGAFPANELDRIRGTMPEHLRVSPLLSMIYLVFNTRQPPFDDARIREALAIVIEPRVLTDKVQRTGNYPAVSFVPFMVDDYESPPATWQNEPPPARAERARSLLRAAGYGPDNPLHVTLRYYDEGDGKRTNVAIASFWKQIGVSTALHHSELKVHFSDLRSGDFQVAQAGWIGENNPGHYLDLLVSDAGNVNYGGYHSAAYDALMNEARSKARIPERYALMAQAEALALQEFPVVPLWSVAVRRLVDPRLNGWHGNNRDVHPVRFLSW